MARAGKLHMSFDFNSNMTECIEYHISVRYPIFLISDAYAIYALQHLNHILGKILDITFG